MSFPRCTNTNFVGISENGEIGKYLRKGQGKESTACGAVLAAYDACKSGSVSPSDELDPYDMQQSWLKKKIQEQMGVINKAEEPLSQLARTAYDVFLPDIASVCQFVPSGCPPDPRFCMGGPREGS